MRSSILFMLVLSLAQCGIKQEPLNKNEKIKLLILSGRNNHEWEITTPLLVRMYEESGLFSSDISEKPDTLILDDFYRYDVVVSNFTAWPERTYRWPKATEDGLMEFIENGGGFVVFHAASAAFYDWPEFQGVVGTTWGDSTRHGRIAAHEVVIKDRTHPITNGMQDFWITDELWVKAVVNSELNVLAESYSDPANKGRGVPEPVLHWKNKGKGRVFHNVLGHNPRAMKNTAWKTLMLRGTEWAASGEVSIPVPVGLSTNEGARSLNYSWSQTDTTIALLNNAQILWQYNFNTTKGKPFFHPVNIRNSTITWLSPDDHPWHLGIWHSWKFINGVNYWEYDRSEGVAPFNFLGITEVRNIDIEKGADHSCTIHLDIYYHERNGPDLIHELRKVSISPPDSKGQFSIDYNFELTALADEIELSRTPLEHEENGESWGGYAGLSMRFRRDSFDPIFINPDITFEKGHGERFPWKYFGVRDIHGNRIGAAIFDYPSNLNSPTPWYVTDLEDHPFYYFGPAPLFNAEHTMLKDDELKFSYHLKFYADDITWEKLDKDYNTYLDIANNSRK